MFKEYYLLSLKNLAKNPLFAAINIMGLTVGIACCILIAMVVKYEFGFDRYFTDAGRIYRLGSEIRLPDSGAPIPLAGTVLAGPAQLQLDFPNAIESYARMQGNMLSFRHQDDVFAENVYFVDPDFFNIFDLKFIYGSGATAMQAPFSVVLTRSMAKKYFGDVNPVGKTLSAEGSHDLKVTGVIEDVPANTHFDLGIVISMNSTEALLGEEAAERLNSWEPSEADYGYVKLKPGVDPAPIEAQLDTFLDKHAGEILKFFPFKVYLQRLDDIHLHPGSDEPAPSRGSHIFFIYAAIILGVLILTTACINFVNLTTARMSQRSKEIGIRKTVGAKYKQIVIQLLVETFALVLISTGLAYILANTMLPLLGNLIDRDFSFARIWDWQFGVGILFLALFTTVLAGLYPSLVLSRIPVDRALKGETSGRPKNRLRQVLIVVQFTLATLLIIVTLVGSAQVRLFKSIDLGYKQDQAWMLTPMRSDSATFRFMDDVQENYETMRVELLRNPQITGVTGSFAPRIKASNFNVRKPNQQPGEHVTVNGNQVDADYVKVLGMKLLAGRGFSRDMATDIMANGRGAAILTRSGAGKLGYAQPQDAIGQKIIVFGRNELEIVGVVDDVNAAGGYRALNLDILVNSNRINAVIVNITGDNTADALAYIDKTWNKFLPQRPLNRFPLADIYAMQRNVFERVLGVFAAFSLLAISIACFGLYAISQFVAERRSKEIVLRKVLGASVTDIVRLMLWDFSRPIGFALILAAPLAILFLGKVLSRFPQHASMGAADFLIAAAVTAGLALLTVSLHTWRVANMNPALRLHHE